MRLKLTEEMVRDLPVDGKDRIIFDTLESGFGVRVTPAGAKIFIAQARVGGKPKRLPIGRHPDMKVSEARPKARLALGDMRDGIDPKGAAELRRQEAAAATKTVSELADEWLADHVRLKRKPRTIADYESIVEKKIKPWAGHRAVATITRKDVIRLHKDMANTPRRANYVVAVIRAMLSYAEKLDLRPQGTNPAKGIEAYREQARETYLDSDQLALAAELIDKAEQSGKIGPHVAGGLRLCLFTGCRSGEATAIEWSHVDIDGKVIRLPDSKANRPRIIHLNGPAIATLERLPRFGKYVVASNRKDVPVPNLGQGWQRIRKGTSLAHVRLHDLRHSFASAAVARGLSLPMIGKLLGHTVPATTARYAHLAQDPVAAANEIVAEAYAKAGKTVRKRKAGGAKVIPMSARMRKNRSGA